VGSFALFCFLHGSARLIDPDGCLQGMEIVAMSDFDGLWWVAVHHTWADEGMVVPGRRIQAVN
jgi:hypothetical protein